MVFKKAIQFNKPLVGDKQLNNNICISPIAVKFKLNFGRKEKKSMKNNNQFVTPHNGLWQVKGANNSKATNVFDTQQQAIDKAISIAKNKRVEVVIQGKNGKIRSKNSYGNDPFPPKG